MSLSPTKKQNSKTLTAKKSNQKLKKQVRKRTTGPNRRVRRYELEGVNAAKQRSERFHLSPCSRLYLKALLNPYSVEGGKACIPDMNDYPSYKVLCIARGTFNVGNGQVGYIMMNPRAASNDAIGAFRYTTAAYLGTVVEANTAVLGVNALSFASLPYLNAQIVSPAGVLSRTVGCGLRVRYTGTELNRSGRLIPWRAKALSSGFVNGSSTSTFLNDPMVPSIACTRQWHSVTYLPSNALGTAGGAAYEYLTGASSDNTGITISTALDLGFIVDGATIGNGFEWEVYLHKEYVTASGALVPPGITASHSDMPGFSAIRNAVEGDVPIGDGPGIYDRALKYIENFGPADMSHISGTLKTGAETMKMIGWL